MPEPCASMRSTARCVLPVLVGPRTAVTGRREVMGLGDRGPPHMRGTGAEVKGDRRKHVLGRRDGAARAIHFARATRPLFRSEHKGVSPGTMALGDEQGQNG